MTSNNKQKSYQSFLISLETFREKMCLLGFKSTLSTEECFLKTLARSVEHLYQESVQIGRDDDEKIQETCLIIKNIFELPLSTEINKRLSFKKAVQLFPSQEFKKSDLSHLMQAYAQHPETTRLFIRELSILTKEIEETIQKTG